MLSILGKEIKQVQRLNILKQMKIRSIGLLAVLCASLLAAQEAVSARLNPKDGLMYVWIPPGTFTMGCSPRDNECADHEKPAHRVTISRGFWIGQTEVTQAAYLRVTRSNPSEFKGASLPVERISWDEAEAYCKAVGMRLPTEAEWEYAARGGNPAARYGTVNGIAWYSVNSGITTPVEQDAEGIGRIERINGGRTTHKVRLKQANGYRLYDMLGNVEEWVADWYDDKYYASSPVTDPKGPSGGVGRIVRGGSISDGPMYVRASTRGARRPEMSDSTVGVRCAGD